MTQAAVKRIDKKMAALAVAREAALRAWAAEVGFKPCSDCFDGFCTMNCSSAPNFIKALI